MTIISATSHTYRSRVDGTLIAQIEIAPNDRAAYLELFGMPGAPMALARLTPGAAQDHAQRETIESDQLADAGKLIANPKGGAYSKLAAIWCKEADFWNWVSGVTKLNVVDERAVKEWVCATCGVESRAELDHNKEAAEKFNRIVRLPYMEYLNNN